MKIIRSIILGETDSKKLAEHRHYNCKKSKEEIAKALLSNGRQDYLFCLEKEVKLFDFITEEIQEIDIKLSSVINENIETREEVVDDLPVEKKHKRLNKNSLKTIDLNIASYQYFGGVDLLEIPRVSFSIALTLISEIGPAGFNKFPTSKHFTSWLR